MELNISKDSVGGAAIQKSLEEKESHLHIQVDRNVAAVVILDIESTVESAVIESTVSDGAKLTVLCMQSPLTTHQIISQSNKVGEGASLHCQNVTLGSQVEHAIVSHLNGANAVSSVDWIAYANNNEKQQLSARNVFNAAGGGGEITMKGVAENNAHLVCNGMIDIESGGGGTDTYLTEDILMLDPNCIVDAVPGLEIKTNDVRASHSATVSKVTAEDLFYFGARGIPQKQAREMYVLGFLSGVITDEGVLKAIEQKYSSSFQ